MKVKALYHLQQHVGSLSIERVYGTVFELSQEDADKALAAGLIETLESQPVSPKQDVAKNRKTK